MTQGTKVDDARPLTPEEQKELALELAAAQEAAAQRKAAEEARNAKKQALGLPTV